MVPPGCQAPRKGKIQSSTWSVRPEEPSIAPGQCFSEWKAVKGLLAPLSESELSPETSKTHG